MNEARTMYRACGPLGLLDYLAHRLHLPRFVTRRICDALDRSLGL